MSTHAQLTYLTIREPSISLTKSAVLATIAFANSDQNPHLNKLKVWSYRWRSFIYFIIVLVKFSNEMNIKLIKNLKYKFQLELLNFDFKIIFIFFAYPMCCIFYNAQIGLIFHCILLGALAVMIICNCPLNVCTYTRSVHTMMKIFQSDSSWDVFECVCHFAANEVINAT